MNRHRPWLPGHSRFNLIAICAALLTGLCPTMAQLSVTQQEERRIEERIQKIIRNTIEAGTGETREGVRFWTPTPPTKEDIKEVKNYGDSAIKVLGRYLRERRDNRETLIAMRLLGSIGGKEILEPLAEVLQKHDSAFFRSLAIDWLSQAPWELVRPILLQTAQKDPDPQVRKAAQEALRRQAPQ